MAALTGLAEFVLVSLLFRGEMRVIYAVAGHLLVLIAIVVQALILFKQGRDLRLSFILFAFTLATGPAGAPSTCLAAALTSGFAKEARPFEEWYGTLFPDDAQDGAGIFSDVAIERTDQQNIIPLIDVLTFGSHAQKQALLTMVTSDFKPPFAAILKTALNDSNNAIRVQAATGITKIEKDFMTRAVTLTRNANENPNDPEALRTIARHYDEYAYIGLLDPDREKECRNKALHYYERYLDLAPNDRAVQSIVGRMLVRDHQFEKAVTWFERMDAAEGNAEEVFWYLESLFRTGKFETVRSVLTARERELEDNSGLPVEILETARLWLAGGAGENA